MTATIRHRYLYPHYRCIPQQRKAPAMANANGHRTPPPPLNITITPTTETDVLDALDKVRSTVQRYINQSSANAFGTVPKAMIEERDKRIEALTKERDALRGFIEKIREIGHAFDNDEIGSNKAWTQTHALIAPKAKTKNDG